MPAPGQQSLSNFYQSVSFHSPVKAAMMSEDIVIVGVNALFGDHSDGQAAAERLRETSRELPEVLRRVLDSALEELGYS